MREGATGCERVRGGLMHHYHSRDVVDQPAAARPLDDFARGARRVGVAVEYDLRHVIGVQACRGR